MDSLQTWQSALDLWHRVARLDVDELSVHVDPSAAPDMPVVDFRDEGWNSLLLQPLSEIAVWGFTGPTLLLHHEPEGATAVVAPVVDEVEGPWATGPVYRVDLTDPEEPRISWLAPDVADFYLRTAQAALDALEVPDVVEGDSLVHEALASVMQAEGRELSAVQAEGLWQVDFSGAQPGDWTTLAPQLGVTGGGELAVTARGSRLLLG
ncbi:hypothetical protein [Luteococcus peritonei]|uniref:Uncharacterized protein n=1 Tax=Luteococcus peritonei TaxID=88874 RepID=A0ABW4RSP2_9ACTN